MRSPRIPIPRRPRPRVSARLMLEPSGLPWPPFAARLLDATCSHSGKECNAMRHSTVHNALIRPSPQRLPRRAWPVRASRLALAGVLGLAVGCGTTRMTDTLRTATEQLLVSNAIDQAVSELDFRELSGKTVYFDPQYLDGVVDRGYLVSSLRQQLLASGCVLQDDRTKARYVVEVPSGGDGTNRHALLVGIPQ